MAAKRPDFQRLRSGRTFSGYGAAGLSAATERPDFQRLTPKSVVTIVTSRPPYAPGAEAEWTAEMPISRHRAVSRFALCSGLFSHIRSAPDATTSGDDQSRFSPTDQ